MTFPAVNCDRDECVAAGNALIAAEKAERIATAPVMTLTANPPIEVNLDALRGIRRDPYNRRHPRRKGFWG